ncbi:MAG TPA: hypothetical protein VF950_19510, partial [Planctomycetota bacterium]
MLNPVSWGVGGFIVAGKGTRGRTRIERLLGKADLSFSLKDRRTEIEVDLPDGELRIVEDVECPGVWFFSGGAGPDEGVARRIVSRMTEVMTAA